MSSFLGFEKSLDVYTKIIPKEISAFCSNTTKSGIYVNNSVDICRFKFSKEGLERDSKLNNQAIPNTMSLYNAIKKEFCEESYITWLKFVDIKTNGKEYSGIEIKNECDRKLNIYFDGSVEEKRKITEDYFRGVKDNDLFEYSSNLINKDNGVRNFVIRPAVENKSNILYILDNEEYSNSFFVFRKLGYYYNQNQDRIDVGDYNNITKLIELFLNKNMKIFRGYAYSYDGKCITKSLKFDFMRRISLEIVGKELIAALEKQYLIDNISFLMNSSEATKVLKLGVNQRKNNLGG